MAERVVTVEEARRIAVRAQALDGSATDVLETVRRLGFLQLDPISSVAPPQHLVLWSRLVRFDTAELDRLLWEEKRLVEFRAYLYPIEDLPMLKAFMRRNDRPLDNRRRAFLRANTAFSRYVLKELRERGPLLAAGIALHGGPRLEHHRVASRSSRPSARSQSSGGVESSASGISLSGGIPTSRRYRCAKR